MTFKTNDLSCLILTPYSPNFREIYTVIQDAVKELGARTPEFLSDGEVLHDFILREIDESDFIIADLTNANPNVMYEIGYATAKGKPVFLIIQQEEQIIPSSLSGQMYFVYDRDNLRRLKEGISRWLPLLMHGLGEEVAQ